MNVIKVCQLDPTLLRYSREIVHEAESIDEVLRAIMNQYEGKSPGDITLTEDTLVIRAAGRITGMFVLVDARFEPVTGDADFQYFGAWQGRKLAIHTRDSDDDCRRYTVEDEQGFDYAFAMLGEGRARRVTLSRLVSFGLQTKIR